MTNYERIKAMSVEEMAAFICGIFDIQPDDSKFINGDLIPVYDENEIRQWLESSDEAFDIENCEHCPAKEYCDYYEDHL